MSSLDAFEFLDLDPETASELDVKKAYVRRLKTTRPDEDRAGFMKLREAYDRAREEVKWREFDSNQASEPCSEEALTPPSAALQVDTEPPDAVDGSYALADEFTPSGPEIGNLPDDSAVDTAMQKISELIRSPFGGTSYEPWRSIIERDDLETFDEFQHLSNAVRWFLCQKSGFDSDPQKLAVPNWLTLPVFRGLSTHFSWHLQQSRERWEFELDYWMADIEEYLTAQSNIANSDQKAARRARRRGTRGAMVSAEMEQQRLFKLRRPNRPTQSISDNNFNRQLFQWVWRIVWFTFAILIFGRSYFFG